MSQVTEKILGGKRGIGVLHGPQNLSRAVAASMVEIATARGQH
jgi:hypothetical protein